MHPPGRAVRQDGEADLNPDLPVAELPLVQGLDEVREVLRCRRLQCAERTRTTRRPATNRGPARDERPLVALRLVVAQDCGLRPNLLLRRMSRRRRRRRRTGLDDADGHRPRLSCADGQARGHCRERHPVVADPRGRWSPRVLRACRVSILRGERASGHLGGPNLNANGAASGCLSSEQDRQLGVGRDGQHRVACGRRRRPVDDRGLLRARPVRPPAGAAQARGRTSTCVGEKSSRNQPAGRCECRIVAVYRQIASEWLRASREASGAPAEGSHG